MNSIRRYFLVATLSSAVAATFFAGCARKSDPISKAEKSDAAKPSIAETKAIAEGASSTACRS